MAKAGRPSKLASRQREVMKRRWRLYRQGKGPRHGARNVPASSNGFPAALTHEIDRIDSEIIVLRARRDALEALK